MVKIPKILNQEINKKYQVLNNALKLDLVKNSELDRYDGKPKDEINVIVGDDKQPDKFYPQVKLCRWSNETNFSVRLIDNENEEESVKTESNKIKYSKGNIDIDFFDYWLYN